MPIQQNNTTTDISSGRKARLSKKLNRSHTTTMLAPMLDARMIKINESARDITPKIKLAKNKKMNKP